MAAPPDEAVLVIDVHTELVAGVALAMFLDVGGISFFLTAPSFAPVGIFALVELAAITLMEVLAGSGLQRGIDGLTTRAIYPWRCSCSSTPCSRAPATPTPMRLLKCQMALRSGMFMQFCAEKSAGSSCGVQ